LIACLLTSKTCIGIINLLDIKDQNFLINGIILIIGFIVFSIQYFFITKIFKVNKLNLKPKKYI